MSSRPRSIRGASIFAASPIPSPSVRSPAARSRRVHDEVTVVLDVLHEPPLFQDPRHDGREGWEREVDPLRAVVDDSLLEVDVQVVPLVDPVCVHDDRGEPDVDRVPVEDPREGLREHGPRARELDDHGRVLPRGALPEVPAPDDDVPRLPPRGEVGPRVLEDVLRELGQVRAQVIVSSRGDEVRRDVVPELPGPAHRHTSRGSVMTPYIAVAAAVAGDARYGNARGFPIRPTYFRFVVERTFSPSPGIPRWTPGHAPQPGELIVAPASRRTPKRPSFIARTYDSFEAGVTMSRVPLATASPLM